jgi:hypothetical protein
VYAAVISGRLPPTHALIGGEVWLHPFACMLRQWCAPDATASLLLQDARGHGARGFISTDLVHLRPVSVPAGGVN